MSELGDEILDVNGAFSNADESVINWKGENYYRACSEQVTEHSFCVKRLDHPGDIHEDIDGVRIGDAKGRMVVVVSFPLNPDPTLGYGDTQAVLHTLRPHFADKKSVLIYAAIKEQADQIIMILEGDG